MQVTLLSDSSGSLVETEAQLLDELSRHLCSVQHYPLATTSLHDCTGCFGCWVQTPGLCVLPDEGNAIARSVIGSDLVVALGPIAFGGFNATLKKAFDRLICLLSPFFTRIKGEVHHRPRYADVPSLLCFGALEHADCESAELFEQWVRRVGINFHAPKATGIVLPVARFAAQREEIVLKALRHWIIP